MRDPADSPRQGKDNRKHIYRNTDRFEDDSGLEIYIRVQLALDEVFVF